MNKPFYRLACLLVFLLIGLQTSFAQSKNDHRSCASMDVFNQQLIDNPNLGEIREAIERHTEDYVPDGLRSVITIPVVFHVIHNGDPVGTSENLDDVYIMAQLDQLNDDFRKLNTDAGNVPAEFAGLHADTEIEFCLAVQDPGGNATTGIIRHDFGQSSWSSSAFNSTVKPATVWDRDFYLNFWTANLSGGLLGYAQFPGGNASTDGVVCLWSSVGSLDVPHPSGGQYDHGRTGTHEIGHWLNLYHTFQGGCNGSGDQVADTPPVDAPNYNCPSHPHSSCGSNDMFMNYMDYVNDNCMIMFSEGQSTRMNAIFSPGGSRASLLNSQGCVPLGSSVTFNSQTTNEMEETTSCATAGTRDILIDLNVTGPPTISSVIEIAVSGTAGDDDATVSPTIITIPAGVSGPETITVTVSEDAYVESDETVILDLSITSGDLILGANTTHTLTLYNDDNAPQAGGTTQAVDENFDTAPAGWVITDGGSNSNTWYYTNNGGSNLDGTPFVFVDSDAAGNGSTSFEQLTSDVFDVSSATSVMLDFDQYFRAYTPAYNESIAVDVFDGSSWQNVYIRYGNSQGSIGSWAAPDHQAIDITAHANANMQLRFTYDAEWDYWWAVDNVVVTATGPADVASAVNSLSGHQDAELGPNVTVHFYDQNSGNVMMTIKNLTNFDYGCTTVEINNEGNLSYPSNAPEAEDITDKNFIVTPQFENPSGMYNITLYYSWEEINGWVASNSEGSSIDELMLAKSDGPLASATSIELEAATYTNYNGIDYYFTGTYATGFSGFGLANENSQLPVELLDFTARPDGESIAVDWSTAVELNNKGFELKRSTSPSEGFATISWIEGRGTSPEVNNYQYDDEDVRSGVWYYYRLKQIDFDGQFEYSPIVSAQIDGASFEIFPNPVSNILQVKLQSSDKIRGQLEVIDLLGSIVMTQNIANESGDQINVNVSDLPNAMYFIRLRDEVGVQDAVRFLKRK